MLTVIIPAYNHESYVLESLEAACSIDLPGVQVIVVDDGSTDSTREKVQGFLDSRSQNNVSLVAKPNGGLVSSLILGLEMAKTEYIYIVASDDIPIPEGIQKAISLLNANPSAMFCVGGAANYFEDSPEDMVPAYGQAHSQFFNMSAKLRAKAMFLEYPQPILLQSTVFRSDALRSIGGWNKNIVLDDYPTFIQLLKRFPTNGKDFYYCPEVLVVKYRQHENNSFKNVQRQFFMVKQMLDSLAPSDVYPEALGKIIAMHFITAIKLKRFKVAFAFFNNVDALTYLYASKYFVYYVMRFLKLKGKNLFGSLRNCSH